MLNTCQRKKIVFQLSTFICTLPSSLSSLPYLQGFHISILTMHFVKQLAEGTQRGVFAYLYFCISLPQLLWNVGSCKIRILADPQSFHISPPTNKWDLPRVAARDFSHVRIYFPRFLHFLRIPSLFHFLASTSSKKIEIPVQQHKPTSFSIFPFSCLLEIFPPSNETCCQFSWILS